MKKTRTTGHSPQSDGFIERFNKTLAAMLRPCREKGETEWDEYSNKSGLINVLLYMHAFSSHFYCCFEDPYSNMDLK